VTHTHILHGRINVFLDIWNSFLFSLFVYFMWWCKRMAWTFCMRSMCSS